MEITALTFDLLHYLLTIVAGSLCLALFRRNRQWGWLLMSVAFLQPVGFLITRAVLGHPMLTYKFSTVGADGLPSEIYRVDFPLLEMLAVIGLVLLVRSARRPTSV